MLRSLLDAYGIPVYLRGGDMPGAGGVTEVGGGFHVMVPVSAERDARALLENASTQNEDGDSQG